MRFMDIRKRVYTFPKMGQKAYFIAIPTSEKTGMADYELLPDMAIVDADMMMNAPKGLTAASGIDALTHALEAYVSMLATDYTDSLALRARAATIAGMAFANAFLGVCHSMAHKLGAFYHLPQSNQIQLIRGSDQDGYFPAV